LIKDKGEEEKNKINIKTKIKLFSQLESIMIVSCCDEGGGEGGGGEEERREEEERKEEIRECETSN